MNLKRIFSLVLVCALFLCFAGCAEKTNETAGSTTANTGNTPEESSSETADNTASRPQLPSKDYEGAQFTFLVTDTGYFGTKDVFVENINGEPINDAVYQRNSVVEDAYNIKIGEIRSDGVLADANKAIMSGDNNFQAVFGNGLTPLAESGGLIDLLSLPYIETEENWWDINIFKEFTLKGKAYFGTGDISIMDDDCTLLLTFNKWLIDNGNLENPYELVDGNKWTIEKFNEMCAKITADLNGDGTWTEEDRYGLSYAYDHVNYYWRAFGNRFSTAKNGETELFELNDNNINEFTAVYQLFRGGNACYAIPDIISTASDPAYRYTLSRVYFTEDKYLFTLSEPLIFYEYRDMKNDFGILPLPKYDETQERYYAPLDTASTLLCVPSTIPDTDFVGLILEEMARVSQDAIKPAYYDITLKRKYSRDNDSEKMLDLIFSSKTYDVAVIYNWGSVNSMLTDLIAKKSTDIASAYEKKIGSIQKQMEKTMQSIKD